jgi:hypothetical protein
MTTKKTINLFASQVRQSQIEWNRFRKASGYRTEAAALKDALNWSLALKAHFKALTEHQSALASALLEK